jgi:hypothetical protein
VVKTKTHRRLAMGFDKSREQIRTQPLRGTTAARSATGSDSNYGSRLKDYGQFAFASNAFQFFSNNKR